MPKRFAVLCLPLAKWRGSGRSLRFAKTIALAAIVSLAGCVESSRFLVCGPSVYGSAKRVGGSKDVAAPAAIVGVLGASAIKENTTLVVRPSSWDVALSTTVEATCTTTAVPAPSNR